MDNQLIDAYHQTEYRVLLGEKSFNLTIGQYCQALKGLFDDEGVRSATFITAWNPRSQLCDENQNKQRQRTLKAELCRKGFRVIPGFGEDPSGKWPGEESIFVLGIDKSSAIAVGYQYEQNAIVYIGEDIIPRLVLIEFE